ncbi:hypothetical protein CAPTEDRAFT_216730 [Capitella teleta]|uniref:Ubiquitin-like protease family profile domain-containing protein n=1 Tax=Capitella teleta TaxID=283909 RepID=R7UYK8_CAPTE|nr:hypothetical protein CAPTEDRAFT_216730 [Capitella teleta]|eukprot:ELU11362.1 hypothetical protein CAPTEDRAFT_216730 [Capitella teleta]
MEIQRRQSVKNPAGYLVACRDGILLRDVELATVLKTDEWLSDADVNMFMHCAALQAPLLQIRVLECFAMRRLIEGKRLNARVLKNIQDVDLILGPILESGHWTLLVMYPKERRSVYIDPFGCSNTALERFKQISRRMMRPHFTSGVDRWGIQTLQHTRQRDGSSCGVLVCKFAQNIIESKPLEVPNIMAARKEIVTMLLDYTDLTMLDEYCTYCCCMEDDGEGVIEWFQCQDQIVLEKKGVIL